jgi:hypothetical protein
VCWCDDRLEPDPGWTLFTAKENTCHFQKRYTIIKNQAHCTKKHKNISSQHSFTNTINTIPCHTAKEISVYNYSQKMNTKKLWEQIQLENACTFTVTLHSFKSKHIEWSQPVIHICSIWSSVNTSQDSYHTIIMVDTACHSKNGHSNRQKPSFRHIFMKHGSTWLLWNKWQAPDEKHKEWKVVGSVCWI